MKTVIKLIMAIAPCFLAAIAGILYNLSKGLYKIHVSLNDISWCATKVITKI